MVLVAVDGTCMDSFAGISLVSLVNTTAVATFARLFFVMLTRAAESLKRNRKVRLPQVFPWHQNIALLWCFVPVQSGLCATILHSG